MLLFSLVVVVASLARYSGTKTFPDCSLTSDHVFHTFSSFHETHSRPERLTFLGHEVGKRGVTN